MANHRDGNVIYVDTTDSEFPDVRNVKSIKYIGAASGTATIKGISSGLALWEASGDVEVHEDVCIRCDKGIEVEVTSGAVVYVYTTTR